MLTDQWTGDLVAPLSVTAGERAENMCMRKKKEKTPVVDRGIFIDRAWWVMRLQTKKSIFCKSVIQIKF